ncbi:hypothetical protein [Roseibium sp.]|uniref:hypothetical protein n=1 Tax=Roseibium sp. TaxID=1936156 RepID=UPI003A9739A3
MMLKQISAIVGAGLLAIISSHSADAGSVERFRLGNWNGDAYVDDNTGAFSSCVASASYRSGISMSVQVDNRYDWYIGFSAPGWNLTVGQDIPLQYRIDRGPWQHGTARVQYNTLARMPMPDNGYIITRFRRGRTLYVYDGKQTYEFRLTGTSKLLARLARCVKTNLARYGSGGPSAGSAPTQLGSAPSGPAPLGGETSANATLQVEATQALFNLMGQARVTGLKLLPEDQRKPSFQGLHAVAADDNRTIVAHILQAGSYTNEQEIMAQIIADSAKACDGSFSSGSEWVTEGGKSMLTSYAHCQMGDEDLVERAALVNRTAGGLFVYGVADVHIGGGNGVVSEPLELSDPDWYAAVAGAAN